MRFIAAANHKREKYALSPPYFSKRRVLGLQTKKMQEKPFSNQPRSGPHFPPLGVHFNSARGAERGGCRRLAEQRGYFATKPRAVFLLATTRSAEESVS
jgi:hypothetical protein